MGEISESKLDHASYFAMVAFLRNGAFRDKEVEEEVEDLLQILICYAAMVLLQLLVLVKRINMISLPLEML